MNCPLEIVAVLGSLISSSCYSNLLPSIACSVMKCGVFQLWLYLAHWTVKFVARSTWGCWGVLPWEGVVFILGWLCKCYKLVESLCCPHLSCSNYLSCLVSRLIWQSTQSRWTRNMADHQCQWWSLLQWVWSTSSSQSVVCMNQCVRADLSNSWILAVWLMVVQLLLGFAM